MPVPLPPRARGTPLPPKMLRAKAARRASFRSPATTIINSLVVGWKLLCCCTKETRTASSGLPQLRYPFPYTDFPLPFTMSSRAATSAASRAARSVLGARPQQVAQLSTSSPSASLAKLTSSSALTSTSALARVRRDAPVASLEQMRKVVDQRRAATTNGGTMMVSPGGYFDLTSLCGRESMAGGDCDGSNKNYIAPRRICATKRRKRVRFADSHAASCDRGETSVCSASSWSSHGQRRKCSARHRNVSARRTVLVALLQERRFWSRIGSSLRLCFGFKLQNRFGGTLSSCCSPFACLAIPVSDRFARDADTSVFAPSLLLRCPSGTLVIVITRRYRFTQSCL